MKQNQIFNSVAWVRGLANIILLTQGIALQAQSWQTVLDYQLVAGKNAEGEAIAADALGNVFAGGNGNDLAGTNHGLVLKTDTTQATWYGSDDTNPNATQYQSQLSSLGLDANGNVYSVGYLSPDCSSCAIPPYYWYVRKSSDSGTTWSTVDVYQYAPGELIFALGLTGDNSGGIYVVGYGNDAGTKKNSGGNNHWLVRQSTNGGQTWTLVDDVIYATAHGAGFVPGAGVFAVGQNSSVGWMVRRSVTGNLGTWSTVDNPFAGEASAVCGDSNGNIYVAGYAFVVTQTKPSVRGYNVWTIRKSSDGGSHWSTVDTFAYAQNQDSYVTGIGKDALGNVVAVGHASDGQTFHWIVRRPDTSGVWQTVDDYQVAPGYPAYAAGVTTDAAGHLLVTGNGLDANRAHWIVRRF